MMTETTPNDDGAELLAGTLRKIGNNKIAQATCTERMRAALALAYLQKEGNKPLTLTHFDKLHKLINGFDG